MSGAERDALRTLTTAVAKAANPGDPDALANLAIETATTTVAQRRVLEAAALQGRTSCTDRRR